MTVEIDLHGLTVDHGVRELERAIDDALAAGERKIKIIHGKGTGRLREAVWAHLRKEPRVERFELDSTVRDGSGATVAYILM